MTEGLFFRSISLDRSDLVLHNSNMRATGIPSILAATMVAIAATAQTVPSADQLLAKAKTSAAAEKKNLFIIFGASW